MTAIRAKNILQRPEFSTNNKKGKKKKKKEKKKEERKKDVHRNVKKRLKVESTEQWHGGAVSIHGNLQQRRNMNHESRKI